MSGDLFEASRDGRLISLAKEALVGERVMVWLCRIGFHRWSTYWANVAPRSGGGPTRVADGCVRCFKRREVRNVR